MKTLKITVQTTKSYKGYRVRKVFFLSIHMLEQIRKHVILK